MKNAGGVHAAALPQRELQVQAARPVPASEQEPGLAMVQGLAELQEPVLGQVPQPVQERQAAQGLQQLGLQQQELKQPPYFR